MTGWREAGGEPADNVFKKWLRGNGTYLILGEPGGGKTTLLRYWSLQKNGNRNMVYVPLRNVQGHKSPLSYFKEKLGDSYNEAVNENTVFLLDGWDELETRNNWAVHINDLPGIKIISCRTAQYNDDFDSVLSDKQPHYIMGLVPKDQRQFLSKLVESWEGSHHTALIKCGLADANEEWAEFLWKAIQKHPQVKQIAGSPLLLTLIALVSPPKKPLILPKSRSEFYRDAFYQLCKNRHPAGIAKSSYTILRYLLRILVGLAGRETKIHMELLTDAYSTLKREGLDAGHTQEVLENLALVSGILRAVVNSYEFLHLTFQEWLLAEALYKEHGLLKVVEDYWRDADYDEVLALAWSSATAEEREKATEYLIETGCQDAILPADKKPKNRSGLRTALHLWSRSGEELEGGNSAAFKMFMTAVSKSELRKRTVARDDSAPGDVLRKLAKDEGYMVRIVVAGNSSTPVDVLQTLAKDEDRVMRSSVARNSSTPVDVLRNMLEDEDSSVRSNVAKNNSTPKDVLQKLAKDKDKLVRRGVAWNSSAPENLLRELAKDEDNDVCQSVAENSSTPENVLRALAKDGDEHMRWRVAGNNSLPEDVLRKLAEDEEGLVRRSVAKNSSTPVDILNTLAKDKKYMVRIVVAGNISTPEDVLRTLAEDKDEDVRSAVADNSSTPEEVLRTLAEDRKNWVRGGVAKNSSTPVDILQTLVKDEDEDVRSNVARNSSMPEELLRNLTEDENIVRIGVAANSSAPGDILQMLAKDEDFRVREGVAWNRNACLEWL